MSHEDVGVAEERWRMRAMDRAHLGAKSTGDKVEREAEWCHAALSNVLDATAKQITICAHSKRWWNGHIEEKRSQLVREKRRRRTSAATAQAKAKLQKSFCRAKDKMWNDNLNYLRGAEVWRALKFANPQAGMTVEALTDREGKEAIKIAKKDEMLRRESFPRNWDDQYFQLPPAGQSHQSITDQAVKSALILLSIRTAPGPDKLSFGDVRLLWKWDNERIVELAKRAVSMGRHQAVWKRVSEIVVRKPGKDNYTNLKANRCISLLSCMRKVVEKVVADLLA